jgi:hypothetical protein
MQSYRDTVAYLEGIVGFLGFIHVEACMVDGRDSSTVAANRTGQDRPILPRRRFGRSGRLKTKELRPGAFAFQTSLAPTDSLTPKELSVQSHVPWLYW